MHPGLSCRDTASISAARSTPPRRTAPLRAAPPCPPRPGPCHAWLEAGGTPKRGDVVMQQCGLGLVSVRRAEGRPAFAAPPLQRSGPVNEDELQDALQILNLGREDVVEARWIDNGPGWLGIMLMLSRRFEAGIVEARKMLEIDPLSSMAYFILGAGCRYLGRSEEAIAAMRKGVELSGDAAFMLGWLGMIAVAVWLGWRGRAAAPSAGGTNLN